MKKGIKLAAIHSRCVNVWKEADGDNTELSFTSARKYLDENTEKIRALLHEAGKSKVDLVCTHEDYQGLIAHSMNLRFPSLLLSLAEEIPGPASKMMGEVARQYGMYVAANYLEREGNTLYNTSVLIDRNGGFVGKYRKVHLPASEVILETAGSSFPVFETDIGRIGFATCYDILFPEHCRSLALNGADIIIHQTQGWGMICDEIGEAMVRVRAAENAVYMLVCKNIQTGVDGKSCVISNFGSILAESEVEKESIMVAEFEPDFDMIDEEDFNSVVSGISSLKVRHKLERKPSLYGVITCANPPVLDHYKDIVLKNKLK